MDYYPSMDDNSGVVLRDQARDHPIKAALKRTWPPMSQAKLARRLDINTSLLNIYLNGHRDPPEGFYIAVAAVLGCEPDELRPTEPEVAA